MLQQKADCLFSHAHMQTSLVTTRLFSAFKGRYPVFLSDLAFKFHIQTAFRIKLLPFSTAYIRRYTENTNTKKCSIFTSNMAAKINL